LPILAGLALVMLFIAVTVSRAMRRGQE
jgi:hypothetical protein